MEQELFPVWTRGALTLCRVSDEGYVLTTKPLGDDEDDGHTEVVTGIAELFRRIVEITGRAESYGQLVYMVSAAVETRRVAEIKMAIEILTVELGLAERGEELIERLERRKTKEGNETN